MKVKMYMIFCGLALIVQNADAQFYTIKKEKSLPETKQVKVEPKEMDEEDYFFSYQDSINADNERNLQKEDESRNEYFSTTEGHEISIEKDVPVFVNMRDSLVFGLIKQRMDVCLPLDYISVNSHYGYRNDPYSKCKAFHDGIDLQCNFQHVYSMLPGKVIKTVYGNKGYGNYVIMDYGHLQVLYGHLAAITVRVGDDVYAGTIIGISGNSGKSTGPHLHLKIMAGKKSLNPEPFIGYLNRYITGLQDKIAYVRFGVRPDIELNIGNLYKVMQKYNIAFPKIVVAQALLETGYFTSNVCLNCNNLFGLRRPSDGSYYRFDSWEESVKAYKDYIQRRYKGGDYFKFLDNIGYAEDRNYINKVRSISRSL